MRPCTPKPPTNRRPGYGGSLGESLAAVVAPGATRRGLASQDLARCRSRAGYISVYHRHARGHRGAQLGLCSLRHPFSFFDSNE